VSAKKPKALAGKKIAYLIAPFFEDEEGTKPKEFLEKHGAKVVYVGLARASYRGKSGRAKVDVDRTFDEVAADQFDAIVIPGGLAPQYLRSDSAPIDFIKEAIEQGKVVAAICHGPQLLISADVVAGKNVTGYAGIRDEIEGAGANYVDQPVVVDERLITSRQVSDIPEFSQAIYDLLAASD
jgi:protease I